MKAKKNDEVSPELKHFQTIGHVSSSKQLTNSKTEQILKLAMQKTINYA